MSLRTFAHFVFFEHFLEIFGRFLVEKWLFSGNFGGFPQSGTTILVKPVEKEQTNRPRAPYIDAYVSHCII